MVRPSPDGEWLSWTTFPEGALWRSRRDGNERLRLTGSDGFSLLPSWSPDGEQIAFIGMNPGDSGWSVRIVAADGGPIDVVARPKLGSNFWDPCWLPDGRSLIFGHLNPAFGRGIHRLDLATRTLTPFDGAEDLSFPKCGPQGQLLASRSGDSSRPSALVLYRPQRETWEDLGPDSVAYPTWTRDGRSFCGLAIQENRIECYSIATRRFETLAEIGDNPLLSWVYFPWFGLDADDNPLVMLDRSTRDLYALDWEAP